MFRLTRRGNHGPWTMDPIEDQPLWIEYLPRPGGLGYGRPPKLGDRLPIQCMGIGLLPQLDDWSDEDPPLCKKHKAWISTSMSLEDSASLVSHAEPALLYDPCPEANFDLFSASANPRPIGPGCKDTWPSPLNTDTFLFTEVGQKIYDVDNLNLVTEPGDPLDWCKITITPPGIPQVKHNKTQHNWY